MSNTTENEPESVDAASASNDQLGEPDLDAPLLPGYTSTWRDKKEFCFLEGKTYAEQGADITENPYIENTWPWRWFNEAYMKYADCVAV